MDFCCFKVGFREGNRCQGGVDGLGSHLRSFGPAGDGGAGARASPRPGFDRAGTCRSRRSERTAQEATAPLDGQEINVMREMMVCDFVVWNCAR